MSCIQRLMEPALRKYVLEYCRVGQVAGDLESMLNRWKPDELKLCLQLCSAKAKAEESRFFETSDQYVSYLMQSDQRTLILRAVQMDIKHTNPLELRTALKCMTLPELQQVLDLVNAVAKDVAPTTTTLEDTAKMRAQCLHYCMGFSLRECKMLASVIHPDSPRRKIHYVIATATDYQLGVLLAHCRALSEDQ